MFESGGTVYVYKIYGVHRCLNIVAEKKGAGCAVLIRAGEPLLGLKKMSLNRGVERLEKICVGPGNFARAFGFDLRDNYRTVFEPDLFVQDFLDFSDSEIVRASRIGISKSKDLPLRFYLKNSKFVSKRSK